MGADFSLHQIELFVAVAEELHFHRAAERMHISQPPLTRHIRALEGSLGVQLFERSSRAVSLTRAGTAFLGEARRVLAAAGRASATARRAAQGAEETIIVGCVESAAVHLLPCVLAEFCEDYPDISVDVREMHTRQQEAQLVAGEIDLAVLRPPTAEASLSTMLLYSDNLVAAVTEKSPHDGPINLHELAKDRFIVHNRALGVGVYSAVMQTCISAGFVPEVVQEASSTAMLLGLVGAGRGVCLLPEPYTLTKPYGVKFLKLLAPTAGCGVAMTWRADDESATLRTLRQTIAHTASELHGRRSILG